jgi:DNA-binding beta-propeller fold protein YncE
MKLPDAMTQQPGLSGVRLRASCLLVAAYLLVVAIACSSSSAQGAEQTTPKPRFVLEWGGQGSKNGEFDFPIGIAISRADEVFVTDFTNARVQKFSAAGKFLAAFAVSPFPGGIALDQAGNLFIAHMGIPPSRFDKPRCRDKVAVFTAAGKPLREWGKFGRGDGEFDMPGGIAISRDGRVYVADQCNRRIQVFDAQGKFLTKWGRKGFKPGEFGGAPHPKAFFAGPTFLACDEQGNIYTTEAPLCRVQKFTSKGEFLLAWGDNGVAAGHFGGKFTAFGQGNMQGPTGICFDARGRLWINSIGGRIQLFTDKGQYLSGFGEEGTEPGQFYAPHGLAIDSHGCLYIVDAFNHRIQKFDIAR